MGTHSVFHLKKHLKKCHLRIGHHQTVYLDESYIWLQLELFSTSSRTLYFLLKTFETCIYNATGCESLVDFGPLETSLDVASTSVSYGATTKHSSNGRPKVV